MLQKFGIPVILCVIVILTGCDQGQKMMKPILTPETTPPVVTEEIGAPADPVSDPIARPDPFTETIVESLPELTFDNALTFEPGQRYRMIPTDVETGRPPDGGIFSVSWGNVNVDGKLIEGFTVNDSNVFVWFSMINAGKVPYAFTVDGRNVIEEGDEIVIEIVERSGFEGSDALQPGGVRGNKFQYRHIEYSAILIRNLTHPDRKFEYE